MIGDARLQAALAQLHGISFWDLDPRIVQSRVVAVARLHQPAPPVCRECAGAWPCDTWKALIDEEPA